MEVAFSPVRYGSYKTGMWTDVAPDTWEEQILEPQKVYQFNYLISEIPSWLRWLPWCQIFDPQRYISELRGELAAKMGVSPQEIRVPWFYYDPETRQFAVQVRYAPQVQEVGAIFLTLLAVSGVIIAVTMLITMFGAIFKEAPVLETLKELTQEAKEWLGELAVVMKYVTYIVIGGGSIWVATKVISKLKKRKAEA